MFEKDKRRVFTKAQAAAKVAQCGGLCERCGCELQNGFHMHHVVEHSNGGQTNLLNCQALCPSCHVNIHKEKVKKMERKKDSGFRELREWQAAFLENYKQGRVEGQCVFNYEATPASGKSIFCSEVAYDMIDEDGLDFVLQLMPWDSIRGNQFSGMTKAYDEIGLRTRDSLFIPGARVVAQPAPNKISFLVMYQSACRQEVIELLDMWKKKGKKFGVIFDEIHHTSPDGGTWGSFSEMISDRAEVTVTVSGTYFRTDKNRIQFLEYNDENRPKLSHPAYTYPQAIKDGVVRPVAFAYEDPMIECDDEVRGGVVEYSLSELEGRRLKKAKKQVLDHESESVRRIIKEVHRHTCDMRLKFPNAGALFTCQPSGGGDDVRYVHKIAELVQTITREPVVTVVSSDPKSNGLLENFREGTSPYLVAINKVSEGVDIPRLRVVGMMRYLESEQLFRQIVGRALRRTEDEDGTAAMVVLPKFPMMYQFAMNIYNESLEGVKSRECPDCGHYPCQCPCKSCGENPCICPPPPPPPPPPRFEVLGVSAAHGGGSVGSDDVCVGSIRIAQRIKEHDVSHRHTNEVQLAHALDMAQRFAAEMNGVDEVVKISPLDQLGRVVRSIHGLMNRIVPRFFGNDYGVGWSVLFQKRYGVDFKTARLTWTVEQLEGFEGVLKNVLREGKV